MVWPSPSPPLPPPRLSHVHLPGEYLVRSVSAPPVLHHLPRLNRPFSEYSKTHLPNAVDDVPPELLSFILHQCCSKVTGWNHIPPEDIVVEELSGGLTNKLYKASLKDPTHNQYEQVVVRFFGKDTDMFFERRTEQTVAQTLSDQGAGVKVFGSFADYGGGRLENFHKGRTLSRQDLHNPEISIKIAQSMAVLHSLNMPISHEPCLDNNLVKFLTIARSLHVPHVRSKVHHGIFSFDWLDEQVKWLIRTLRLVHSPVVFTHNDLQEGNVIYDENKGDLQVIDYEYSAYNYRGFDIANHFCEHYIDYQLKYPPFFTLDHAHYPSKEHQMRFINAYLEQYAIELQKGSGDGEGRVTARHNKALDTPEHVYREAQYFMMASNLMWGIWAVIQAVKSDIAFGYMEYAHARITDYSAQKDKVLRELPLDEPATTSPSSS